MIYVYIYLLKAVLELVPTDQRSDTFTTRILGADCQPYTQRHFLEILLNQPEIRLYLPFSD